MTPPLEFSRPIRLAAIPAAGSALRLEASPAECAALATRLGLLALHGFWAELRLRPDTSGAIRAHGTLNAAVEQACVVSLEPVAQRVHEAFTLRILPEGELPSEDPDAEDEVETVAGTCRAGRGSGPAAGAGARPLSAPGGRRTTRPRGG